jgi:hypothetical protein
MDAFAHLALFAGIVCVALALLAPAGPIAIPLPRTGGGQPRSKRPRRAKSTSTRKPMLSAAIARLRRSVSSRVNAKIQDQLDRRATPRPATPAIAELDVAAEVAPAVPAAIETVTMPAAPSIDWPTLMDGSARDLTLERRRGLVRTLDAIAAEYCVAILDAAAAQERDPEILAEIAKARAENPFVSSAPVVDERPALAGNNESEHHQASA